MILIGDIGGTKGEWRLLQSDGTISQASTAGFNPFYQNADYLKETVLMDLKSQISDHVVSDVFYYGAGCSNENNRSLVKTALLEFFPKAKIEVSHDLLAAARALCGHSPGIASILGTGSNSCYFDGTDIIENHPSLGYILGDEGSGAYLGKILLKEFFYGKMPESVAETFNKRFSPERESILNEIYKGETPSRYLAGFTRFIFQHIKEKYFHELVYGSFDKFFECHLLRYPKIYEVPVHFTGSVAFYFNTILRQVATDRKIMIRNIVESPIAGLTLFHKENLSAK